MKNSVVGPNQLVSESLTKREYFAALAMQQLIIRYTFANEEIDTAECAVQYADALINALNKEESSEK